MECERAAGVALAPTEGPCICPDEWRDRNTSHHPRCDWFRKYGPVVVRVAPSPEVTRTEDNSHEHEFKCLTCAARFRKGERVDGDASRALLALSPDAPGLREALEADVLPWLETDRGVTRDDVVKRLRKVLAWTALVALPPGDALDPLTGETLRRAIAAASSLTNPRLSEVEWDDVAAALSYMTGLGGCRHPEDAMTSNDDTIICTRCGSCWPNVVPLQIVDPLQLHRAIRTALPFERWISKDTAAAIAREYAALAAPSAPPRIDVERLAREYDDLEAELETEDVLLSDAEVETIYAAYMLVLGLEARTIQGRRDIVEPLYRAVIQARINTARQVAREYATQSEEDAG